MKYRRDYLLRPLPLTLLILACLGLLFLTAALARPGRLVWGEAGLLEFVYGLPSWLTPAFLVITWLGTVWFMLAQAVVWWLGGKRYKAVYLVAVGGLTLGIIELAKNLVGRPRPVGLLDHIVQRDVFVTGYGFPSGHTALATALALTVTPWLPRRYRWLGGLWISLVALSRLYLGVHAPLDIVGGFVIGVMVAMTGRLLVLPTRSGIKRRVLAKPDH
jgi:membrane-associated phospholipid phosphatase